MGSSTNLSITYITELPPSKRKELCDHCDQIGVWTQMAAMMGFNENDIDVSTLLFLYYKMLAYNISTYI